MSPKFPLHFRGAVLWKIPKTFFFSFTGLSPCIVFLSRKLQVKKKAKRKIHTPHLHYITITDSVWTVPLSLADSYGISIDLFSCRY